MIKLVFDKKSLLIASKWDEVNLTAVLYYLRYYYARLGELIDTNDKGESFIKNETEWLKMHFGLLEGLFGTDGRKLFAGLDGVEATNLVEEHKVTEWMVNELKPMKQLVGDYNGLVGPKEFNHLCTSEFALADIQFLLAKDAMKSGDNDKLIMYLKNFMAVLYREPKEDWTYGDPRQAFDKNSVDARIGRFGLKDKWMMLAAMLWYESHRLALPLRYKHAFEGGGDEGKGLPDWQGAMLTVAETGTFGDFYNVEKTPVHYFIKEIDRKRKLIKEQMEEMKVKS